MARNFILLLLFATLVSCLDSGQQTQNFSDSIVAHFPQWNTKDYKWPGVMASPKTQQLVETLEQDTVVPAQQFTGAYTQLKTTATQDELILLTAHQNPVIRCHAYNTLIDREYSAIHRICFTHFSDTIQKVHCTVKGKVIPLSVRTWMIWQLRPGSGSKYSFEPRLYKRYIREYNDLGPALKKTN